MDAIESLKELDPWAMFCGVIIVLIAWSFLQGLWEKTIGKLLKKVDLETKAMRQKREDKEKLDAVVELAKKTAENLDKLHATQRMKKHLGKVLMIIWKKGVGAARHFMMKWQNLQIIV